MKIEKRYASASGVTGEIREPSAEKMARVRKPTGTLQEGVQTRLAPHVAAADARLSRLIPKEGIKWSSGK
ncbi:MAG: hypothetical protein ACM3IJ_01625 [Candidatus Levyibacteriota bacterium]